MRCLVFIADSKLGRSEAMHGVIEYFDDESPRLFRSLALSVIPRVNGGSLYTRATRTDLWHTHNTRRNRIVYAGYDVMALRLATGFGNCRSLPEGMVWRPAHDPAQETCERNASTAPGAPPPGLQVPVWPVGSSPVATAPLESLGPPPTVAKSGAEGPASRDRMASSSASSFVVVAPTAVQLTTENFAAEFHGANIRSVLITRARDNRQASCEGAQPRAKSVRFSNDEETVVVSPTGKMCPTR